MRYDRTLTLILRLAAIIAIGCTFVHAQDAGAPSPSVARCENSLSIHLSAKETMFEPGHSVPIRIELQNCGQRDLWVALSYEDNLGFPANLSLIVRDHHRRRVLPNSPIQVGGLGKPPYEWWIRLPPGYLYGRNVTLTQYHSAFVNMPGKYQVSVSYSGIPRPRLPTKPISELANLPPEGSEVFTERIESNSLEIEILPKSGS